MTANEQDWLAERFEANRPQLRAVAYPHRLPRTHLVAEHAVRAPR
jgi:hypothetical protein